MKSIPVSIEVGSGDTVSAIVCAPDHLQTDQPTGLIFAHGAANDLNHPLIKFVAEGLAEKGFITLRFNFLYREKGKQTPDSQGTLVGTWKSAYRFFENIDLDKLYGYQETEISLRRNQSIIPFEKFKNIVAVGKSLGGRIVSQMVSEGTISPDKLIFLGYPLHAPGKKDSLRDAHLYSIGNPILYFAGTKDPFCDLDLLKGVLQRLTCPWDLDIVDGGDHSFKLPKSDPREETDVYNDVLNKTVAWLETQ